MRTCSGSNLEKVLQGINDRFPFNSAI